MSGFLDSIDLYLRSGSPLAYLVVFAGGVGISFTPCVYPVLPITVGYIGSRSGGSRGRGILLSLSYVLGLSAVYAALGTAAALSGRVFGGVATSPVANLLVGNACLLMGLAMFDLFHLRLPAALQRAGSSRTGGGPGGAFAAGALSGLVVGPCTAPVLGALLVYVGSRQNTLFGTSLLFVFALGMGTVLLLAGAFVGLVAALPRPGRWLETVRKGFGIVLLLVGEYFLVEAGKLMV